MTLIDQIKAEFLAARKDRNTLATSTFSTLLGEIERIGKNDGNRQTTDQEAVAVIKKFIKSIDEVIGYVGASDLQSLVYEKKLIEQFLPKQMTSSELITVMNSLKEELGITNSKQMGALLKTMKERYTGLFDGKVASEIAKEILT